MKMLKRLLALAVFLAAVWAAIEFRDRNLDPMVVHLLVWQTPPIAVWVVVVVAFLAGALGASLLLLLRVTRSNLTARRYRKAANKLESEVHQLRNLPLAAEPGPGGDGSV
ncbi:MAG: lipopolysaccharide assembly protein LapA domain-containing protein [Myxococcota bacterium]|nr:lipopolysaccharide assembly protein LapA domain-containing protein [Myxococcota bacterium]